MHTAHWRLQATTPWGVHSNMLLARFSAKGQPVSALGGSAPTQQPSSAPRAGQAALVREHVRAIVSLKRAQTAQQGAQLQGKMKLRDNRWACQAVPIHHWLPDARCRSCCTPSATSWTVPVGHFPRGHSYSSLGCDRLQVQPMLLQAPHAVSVPAVQPAGPPAAQPARHRGRGGRGVRGRRRIGRLGGESAPALFLSSLCRLQGPVHVFQLAQLH